MQRFTTDNTEGYDQDQLDELNERLELAIAQAEIEDSPFADRKSVEDHLAERVLVEFDQERS
jgi:hypothetical protein